MLIKHLPFVATNTTPRMASIVEDTKKEEEASDSEDSEDYVHPLFRENLDSVGPLGPPASTSLRHCRACHHLPVSPSSPLPSVSGVSVPTTSNTLCRAHAYTNHAYAPAGGIASYLALSRSPSRYHPYPIFVCFLFPFLGVPLLNRTPTLTPP